MLPLGLAIVLSVFPRMNTGTIVLYISGNKPGSLFSGSALFDFYVICGVEKS